MSFDPTAGGSTTLMASNVGATMSPNAASSLSMEPNPFEQSFANNDSLTSSASNSRTDLPNRRPNQNPNGAPQIHLPAGSPPILTPGGRRHILPPPLPSLSPNINNAHNSNNNNNNNTNNYNTANITVGTNHQLPETPGLMWSSIMNGNGSAGLYQQPTTGHLTMPNDIANNTNTNNNANQPLQLYNHRRTGLTPNESSMRTGLTPGGTGFLAGIQLPGLNTPSSLLNTPALTPGLGSLLEMSNIGHGATNLPQQLLQLPQQTTQQMLNTHLQGQPHDQFVVNSVSAAPQQQLQQIPQQVKREAESPNNVAGSTAAGSSKATVVLEPPAKKQRKRKTKATAAAAVTATARAPAKDEEDSLGSDDQESDSERYSSSSLPPSKKGSKLANDEEKRKNFLERNRVAASKCRQRKKQLVNKMKEELKFYSSEHSTLTSQVNTLREQVITLRTILYGHKECSALLENVGGLDTLNTILDVTNYATQIRIPQPLEPTIAPHTTTIPPIESNKLQQNLLSSGNGAVSSAAAIALTTNSSLNQLNNRGIKKE